MLIRLDKLLSNKGFGSRQQIRKLAAEQKITVNGNLINDVSIKINSDDNIICNGVNVDYSIHTYIIMNKPKGCVCASNDNLHKTVFDLIPNHLQKISLSCVGRLDLDTEGLLILTNDGNFIHDVISPSKNISKTYYVETDKPITDQAISTLEKGIVLITENYITKPAKIIRLSNTSCYITIKEGKFHQVKRMFSSVNCIVTELKRVTIGKLSLPKELNPGNFKIIKKDDLTSIFE